MNTQLQTPRADMQEIAKLVAATVGQVGLMAGFFFGIDKVTAAHVVPDAVRPDVAVFLLLLFLSFRSQYFSILNAQRPFQTKKSEGRGFRDRKLPDWCPPGPVFGIVWSTLGVLRATAGMLVYQQLGALCCVPLVAFAAHLAIGDTWNHINNAQARLGVSAAFNTALVWPSAAAVVALYFQVSQRAGLTITPLVIWLTVANAIVWGTWQLNGKQPLLPRTEDA